MPTNYQPSPMDWIHELFNQNTTNSLQLYNLIFQELQLKSDSITGLITQHATHLFQNHPTNDITEIALLFRKIRSSLPLMNEIFVLYNRQHQLIHSDPSLLNLLYAECCPFFTEIPRILTSHLEAQSALVKEIYQFLVWLVPSKMFIINRELERELVGKISLFIESCSDDVVEQAKGVMQSLISFFEFCGVELEVFQTIREQVFRGLILPNARLFFEHAVERDDRFVARLLVYLNSEQINSKLQELICSHYRNQLVHAEINVIEGMIQGIQSKLKYLFGTDFGDLLYDVLRKHYEHLESAQQEIVQFVLENQSIQLLRLLTAQTSRFYFLQMLPLQPHQFKTAVMDFLSNQDVQFYQDCKAVITGNISVNNQFSFRDIVYETKIPFGVSKVMVNGENILLPSLYGLILGGCDLVLDVKLLQMVETQLEVFLSECSSSQFNKLVPIKASSEVISSDANIPGSLLSQKAQICRFVKVRGGVSLQQLESQFHSADVHKLLQELIEDDHISVSDDGQYQLE